MNSRNYGCRVTHDIRIKGYQAVVMENDKLRITILVDKGTDIIEFLYKPRDIDLMWRGPVSLHKSSDFLSTTGDSFHNYLDHYEGGWQEILPNGGPECFYKGAQLGMHGEVCNIPWEYQIIKDEADEISVKFTASLVRSPFKVEKILTLKYGVSTLHIDETLSNVAAEDMELMWGQHPTIGAPFLSESCEILTSAKACFTYGEDLDFATQRAKSNERGSWPYLKGRFEEKVDFSKVPAADAGTADMLFLTDFMDDAWYEVYNHELKLGYGMKWEKEHFPYVWMWLVCGGSYGYPWYGRTYNLALEPWSSYPGAGLQEAMKNGSALKIEKGQRIKASFEFYITENTR